MFKFVSGQLVAGQHSILRGGWIMMDTLLQSQQLMQLQPLGYLLGIGGSPHLEMVGRASLLVGRLYQSNVVIIQGGLVLMVLQMPSRRLSSLLLG